MQPIVSIVTVCRNSAETITACLRSVANQRYPNIQHIVIDGASSDGTQALIGPNIRPGGMLVSEPDLGIYNAMNKGWRRATGEYVAFLNADDRYANDDVIGHMMAVASSTNVDVVLGDVRFFDPARPHQIVRHYRSGSFRRSLLRWGLMPAHPGMLMRRSLMEKLGGFREDMKIAADFDLCVRSFHGQGCSYIHTDQIVVDMATGGVSTRNLAAKLTINREVVRSCRENGIYSNFIMVMAKYPFKLREIINTGSLKEK